MPETLRQADETTFTLLGGGRTRCGPSWDKPADALDRCYKVYIVTAGSARLDLADHTVDLRSGHAYFIPGYHLSAQHCPDQMAVCWLHAVPVSLYLAYLLGHVTRVRVWPVTEVAAWRSTYERLPDLFTAPTNGLYYRTQAMVLDLVSRVLEEAALEPRPAQDHLFAQLRPALRYLDEHALENPSLAEVARVVHLAPTYFHRRFTALFHQSPLAYLRSRRLGRVRQLLLSTDLTLETIARRCGFSSAFYLSRVFKQTYGLSPSRYRRGAAP